MKNNDLAGLDPAQRLAMARGEQAGGYTAVDVATAAAEGFRDGVGSVAVDLSDLSNCFSPDGCGDWAMWLEDVKKMIIAAGGTVKG